MARIESEHDNFPLPDPRRMRIDWQISRDNARWAAEDAKARRVVDRLGDGAMFDLMDWVAKRRAMFRRMRRAVESSGRPY